MKTFALRFRSVVRTAVAVLALGAIAPAQADRIRDLVQVGGVRTNQLIGYGLVVGLDGSGDQTSQAPFTTQSLENMLQQFGVTVPANVRPQLKNAAAVTITAELPPFAKPGQRIDVTVASIGNAKSIRGGELLMSPLKGADGTHLRDRPGQRHRRWRERAGQERLQRAGEHFREWSHPWRCQHRTQRGFVVRQGRRPHAQPQYRRLHHRRAYRRSGQPQFWLGYG
ncbi:hypothetical protein ACVWWJ_001170 [Luteibacter sp. HA06]